MWMTDLDKAISDVEKVCPDYVITKIVPFNTEIAFYTSHFSIVAWAKGGQITEHFENGETKILKNFSEKG